MMEYLLWRGGFANHAYVVVAGVRWVVVVVIMLGIDWQDSYADVRHIESIVEGKRVVSTRSSPR